MEPKVRLTYQNRPLSFKEAFSMNEEDFLLVDISIHNPYDVYCEPGSSTETSLLRQLKKQLLITYQIVKEKHYGFNCSEEDFSLIFSLLTQYSDLNHKSLSDFYFEESQKFFKYEAKASSKWICLDTSAYDLYYMLANLSGTLIYSKPLLSVLSKYNFYDAENLLTQHNQFEARRQIINDHRGEVGEASIPLPIFLGWTGFCLLLGGFIGAGLLWLFN